MEIPWNPYLHDNDFVYNTAMRWGQAVQGKSRMDREGDGEPEDSPSQGRQVMRYLTIALIILLLLLVLLGWPSPAF